MRMFFVFVVFVVLAYVAVLLAAVPVICHVALYAIVLSVLLCRLHRFS